MNILQIKIAIQEAKRCRRWRAVYRARLLPVPLICAALLQTTSAWAQSYTLDWWDADAGGTSSGGGYTVSGTIGQPEAGVHSGGSFTLSGGFFWGVASVQIPIAPPAITIYLATTNTLVLTWPSASVGFVLQQTADLNTSNWTEVALKPTDDGVTLSVVLPFDEGLRFYRLKK